jgi:hypothetical protein
LGNKQVRIYDIEFDIHCVSREGESRVRPEWISLTRSREEREVKSDLKEFPPDLVPCFHLFLHFFATFAASREADF